MPNAYQRLLSQDFSDLEEAAQRWRSLSQQAEDAGEEHRTKVSGPLHAEWRGEDADSALHYLEDVEGRLGVLRTEAMAIATVLDTVAGRMKQAQTDLRNAVRAAEREGYRVGDDGRVTDPAAAGQPRSDWHSNQALGERGSRLGEYGSRISQAVDDAEQASDDGKKALAELNGDIMERFNFEAESESAADTDRALGALGLERPQVPRDDPRAAADWWRNLDAEQQQEYAVLYPELIGGTDGLPSDVRNEANRLALEQELNALIQNRDEFFGDATNEELNGRQNKLQLLKDELDRRDGAGPDKQLYLLDFDSEGDGKAVIAMGNPDTAEHTAVQVPGTDTTMESVPGQLERIGDLQNAARKAGAEGEVSTVFWLGYDAPEIDLSVTGPGRAEDGAADLRQFTEGTRASHQGAPTHLTVLGHSYGSTMVGAAAAGGDGLGADDIVVVGSPGMTVDEANHLHMDEDHVWVGAAEDDPVIEWTAGLTLGKDPSQESFGGHNFTVDTNGHSGYWQQGSQSLMNQGRIIAGDKPSVVPKREDDIPYVPFF